MATDDPAQGNHVAHLRSPATSENAGSDLAKPAKVDFKQLRTSLKLSDALIGTVAVVLAFCLVYLVGYRLISSVGLTVWLFFARLPIICMILLPLWLARRRRVSLVHWPRIRSILVEAAIAVPIALAIIVATSLLKTSDDGEIRRRWEWLILSGGFRSLFIILPFTVMIVPIAEELFYRAFLYNALRSRIPVVFAAIAQAALFSIIHFRGLDSSIVLFIIGLCLLGIYLWRKTLIAPILVHACVNLAFVAWLITAMVSYANTAELGVMIDSHEKGCLVLEVLAGSAAEDVGLRDGDSIRSIDDQPVEGPEELRSLIQGYAVGERVMVTAIRNGEPLELEAVLGRRSRPNLRESSFGPRDWQLENGKWACYWVEDGDKIRYVFFLKEEPWTLAGPLGHSTSVTNGVYSTHLSYHPSILSG